MTILKEVLLQLFFSLIPTVVFTIYYRDKNRNYSSNFIAITCALCIFLSMTFASSIRNGIMFDARYILMYFGIVFGGLYTGMILLVEFMLYRIYLGGEGMWIAMVIMVCTFPLSLFLSWIYHKTNRRPIITFLAGIVFSILPFFLSHSYFDASYFEGNYDFHILILPVLNSTGIFLGFYLFNKSVVDKEMYLRYAQMEKVKTMSHVAASLAHEVRNPLTVVKGFLKLIRDAALPAEKVKEYIDISYNEIQRTETILSDYLSVSKPLPMDRCENVNLLQELQSITEIMEPFANMNNVRLEVSLTDESAWIFANPDEIRQMLINFIKNAIEACSNVLHGKVYLRLQTESGHIRLTIKDNGIGMDEEQIGNLGSIYFSSKTNGTGLGLTFSYKVIQTLGGSVEVRSEPLVGTVFVITLPYAKKRMRES